MGKVLGSLVLSRHLGILASLTEWLPSQGRPLSPQWVPCIQSTYSGGENMEDGTGRCVLSSYLVVLAVTSDHLSFGHNLITWYYLI